MSRKKVLYFYPHPFTFVIRDEELLKENYQVTSFNFNIRKKWLIPFQFIRQLIFLFIRIMQKPVLICHFAGYNSFLPALFGKIFRMPCFIIVAGNDGSKFPDFNYGNYTRKWLSFFTGKSLQWATRILPVHESLVYQDYHYFEGGKPAQGYAYFFPKAKKTPFTTIYYGYDSDFFKPGPDVQRIRNSFITVGNFSDKYAIKRKGCDIILEFAGLRPDLKFTIVGWDQHNKTEVPENVNLLPFMGLKDVSGVLSKHEFYFQLSIMEGFPNALAEAMLCGCIPFMIGNTGYLLPKRDVNELNILVNNALCDPRRDMLPSLARDRIRNNFTCNYRKNMFEKVINMYK